MNTRNTFVLNLGYLKSQAKRRLRLLKSNEEQQWALVRQYHPKQSLTSKSIKLADIQLVIAREMSVNSWSALKAHIQNQNAHLTAIKLGDEPLDSDLNTLHVRCGHDLQKLLTSAGFVGKFLPWIDPYCVGPLYLNEDKMSVTRAKYVVDNYLSVMTPNEADISKVIAAEGENRTLLLI